MKICRDKMGHKILPKKKKRKRKTDNQEFQFVVSHSSKAICKTLGHT